MTVTINNSTSINNFSLLLFHFRVTPLLPLCQLMDPKTFTINLKNLGLAKSSKKSGSDSELEPSKVKEAKKMHKVYYESDCYSDISTDSEEIKVQKKTKQKSDKGQKTSNNESDDSESTDHDNAKKKHSRVSDHDSDDAEITDDDNAKKKHS